MYIRPNVYLSNHYIRTSQRSCVMTPALLRNTITRINSLVRPPHHTFSTHHASYKKSDQLPPRPTLPDADLKHVYLKGSGPGGQKINKTSSAVQLTHLPTGIVVKSQATRSRTQNHTIAKRILAEKIEFLERGDESRAAKVVERKQKKKRSAEKKKRRKYRRLDEEEEEGASTGVEGVDADGSSEGGGQTQGVSPQA